MAANLETRVNRLENHRGDHLPVITVREYRHGEPVPPTTPGGFGRIIDFTGRPVPTNRS